MKPGTYVLVKNESVEFYTRIFSISDPFVYLSDTPWKFKYNTETGELWIKDGGKQERYAGCTIEEEEGNKENALLITKRRFPGKNETRRNPYICREKEKALSPLRDI